MFENSIAAVKSTLGGDSPIEIDFYYDISSMYSYFAFELIRRYNETLWAGKINLNLHPTVVGFVFKQVGNAAPGLSPLKGAYTARVRIILCPT